MVRFRDRRIMLLLVFVLLSGLFIAYNGPNWGIDITGGTRIMLKVESTQATINLANPTDNHVSSILDNVERELNVPRPIILENYKNTGELKIGIGRTVNENMISPLIGKNDKITNIESAVDERTRDDLINALRNRVDPYGTLGAQFKSAGNQYIRFEVALEKERARTLLGETGRLEIYIDDNLALRGGHISSVQNWSYDSRNQTYYVPFRFTEEGSQRFAEATEGKAGYPGVIYLDRPVNSVLLFKDTFLGGLKDAAQANYEQYLDDARYLENEHYFQLLPRSVENESQWFTVQVKAFRIQENGFPEETENYLLNNIETLSSAIYLGESTELGKHLVSGDNLLIDNKVLPIEFNPRMDQQGELTTQWLERVTGIESYPTISENVAGEAQKDLRITTGGGSQGQSQAEDLKIVLSQSLPAQVNIESAERLDPRLGEEFIKQALRAGLAAFIAVGALVFIRYRRLKIVIPLMLTMLCEVGITLGFSSIIPASLLTLGLPEIGGIIAVVGTGVDHQIIITDEVMSGGASRGGRLPIERRTKRAFSIIFAAAATTFAAMIALATVGLGAMRGFAIVSMIGVGISVLITRPAYAKIIGALLEREQ
ncbi:MAG: hypothetical protein KGY45_01290 [Hadesarchaea archaeon]|nr:hypothetical protein [Hadesarchaea archaeon]